MKKIICSIFLYLFLINLGTLKAQTHSIGFRIEPFLFLSKNDALAPIGHSRGEEAHIDYKSFMLQYEYSFSEEMFLSTRVGYLGTSHEIFNGFEIGEYFGYFLSKKSYLLIGLNIHKNQEDISQYIVKDVTIPFIVPGCGVKIGNNLSVELQYHYPLSKKYKEQVVQWYDPNANVYEPYNKIANYNLVGILKLSFGVEFDL